MQLRGAALSRMSSVAAVTSFSSTRHYGTDVMVPYDEIEDWGRPFKEAIDDQIVTEKVSIFISTRLILLIRKQMTWYINRGDNLSKSTRIPFTFYTNFTQRKYDTGNLWFFCKLYESQEEYVQTAC